MVAAFVEYDGLCVNYMEVINVSVDVYSFKSRIDVFIYEKIAKSRRSVALSPKEALSIGELVA